MNELTKIGRAIRFLLVTIAAKLFGRKSPKPPQSVGNIAELEMYLNKLVKFGAPGISTGNTATIAHWLLSQHCEGSS